MSETIVGSKLEQIMIKRQQTKKISLTFDDGRKYADQVLEKLEHNNGKAAFFLCGNCMEKNFDICKDRTGISAA